MTERRDKAIDEPVGGVGQSVAQPKMTGISRRSLIHGASIAAPAILTLSSSCVQAAAMVSAMVVRPIDGKLPDGKFYCLDETTTGGYAGSGYPSGSLVIDPTRTPAGTRFLDRNYVMPQANGNCGGDLATATPITERQMCEHTPPSSVGNDVYCYKDPGWQTVRVPRGILVSAASMTSAGISPLNFRDV